MQTPPNSRAHPQRNSARPLSSSVLTLIGVLEQLVDESRQRPELSECSLLVEDLGLDSFTFVELTARVEIAFGLEEFPMQEWIDARIDEGAPLTVGALALACETQASNELEYVGR